MRKNESSSSASFAPSAEDLAFFAKMNINPPVVHPLEYLRSVMSCRNERHLYIRNCDKTGKVLISAYHPQVPFPVYQNELWWSDEWDAADYGMPYDLQQPLAPQFKALQHRVPHEGTSVFRSQNCDYNSHIRDSKNCYLCSLIYSCEDCYYCYWVGHDKNVVDSYFVLESELCYECVNCQQCYNCIKVQDSKNCSDCAFSFHLQGCDHCIGCSNLQHKSYHVRNEPVSKERFEEIRKKLINGTRKGFAEGEKILDDIRAENPHRAVFNLNSENVFGDNLRGCKNCYYCFLGDKSEDCRYCISLNSSKDVYASYAVNVPGANELVFASSVVRGSRDIAYSYYIWNSSGLRYCDSCVSCADCFACIGLKHKSHCILNRQYKKKEYEDLVRHIAAGMKRSGESAVAPTMLTSFSYNESAAQDYFPLSKEEAVTRGWQWYEEEEKKDQYMGPPMAVPDDVHHVDKDITKHIFLCEETQKPFKITPQELSFYERMQVPLPRQSPSARHRHRLMLRHPGQLWDRTCAKCSAVVASSYDPERPEMAYCEQCYQSSFIS